MEDRSGSQIYQLCAPNGRWEWLLDLTIVYPQWKMGVALRFNYCVPPMEDGSGSLIYLLCAPNGRWEWLLDLSIVCPQWKMGVALRFIYCVP